MTYKIIRFRKSGSNKVMRRGLSLADAKIWCSREDTKKKDKDGNTIFFDGFTEE